MLVGLTLAAELPRHLHLASAGHDVCAEHGQTAHRGTHVDSTAPSVAHTAHASELHAQGQASSSAGHEHCAATLGVLATCGESRLLATHAAPARGAPTALHDDGLGNDPIAILKRAPKASPPHLA